MKLPENFRGQQLVELLPPGERCIMRWNADHFTLDGGNVRQPNWRAMNSFCPGGWLVFEID